MLNWLPVSVGDMVYVDAGTVHAIGPGVVLLETQQYSDSTYRLYDYGRPRNYTSTKPSMLSSSLQRRAKCLPCIMLVTTSSLASNIFRWSVTPWLRAKPGV